MHPHRRQCVFNTCGPVGNHGCLTRRQEHETRQLPLWRVVDSSRCSRLASAPPWEHQPSTADPLIR
jgi:hypothetical protein